MAGTESHHLVVEEAKRLEQSTREISLHASKQPEEKPLPVLLRRPARQSARHREQTRGLWRGRLMSRELI